MAKKKLTLGELRCETTEDNSGADNAYIKVNGQKVWGPFNINDGEDLDVAWSGSFRGTVAIELWDEDSFDPDDLLGRHAVKPGMKGTLQFNNDDSNYYLKYDF